MHRNFLIIFQVDNSQVNRDIKVEEYDDIEEFSNISNNLGQLTDETIEVFDIDQNIIHRRLPVQSSRRGHSPELEDRQQTKKAYEDDEFDLFGKMLAKKLRKLPEKEAEKFMYKIDEMFIDRYRRVNEHSQTYGFVESEYCRFLA